MMDASWLARQYDALPAASRLGDREAGAAMLAGLDALAKPLGALGRLEEMLAWLARWRAAPPVALDRVDILVFLGSHGIVGKGVSAYPSEVTGQILALHRERAATAIDCVARSVRARRRFIPLSLGRPTADFTSGPAMSWKSFTAAFARGVRAIPTRTDLLCLGEVGIGNTSAAAALAMAHYGGVTRDWVGPGAGSAGAGLARKRRIVGEAVIRWRTGLQGGRGDPMETLRYFGGHEMAAICGAVIEARRRSIPVLLDGFVATSAVIPLHALNPLWIEHCQIGQLSREPGHALLAERLGSVPILSLDVALGEAVGSALAVPLLRAALSCVQGMARLSEL